MTDKQEFVIKTNVEIPARDGVILRADLYKPSDEKPYPVIAVRLPYLKGNIQSVYSYIQILDLLKRGFAVIICDCRGCGDSEGTYTPFRDEKDDGYDTIEWINSQSWCNGRIGMMGQSGFGYTQLAAASKDPSGLVAIAPGEVDAEFAPTAPAGVFGLYTSSRWYMQRVINNLIFSDMPEDEKNNKIAKMKRHLENRQELCWHLPLNEAPFATEEGMPGKNFYLEWVDNIGNKDYWLKMGDGLDLDTIKVPCNILTGWFDFMGRGSIQNFKKLTHSEKNKHLIAHHRMIVGPWTHSSYEDHQGELNFGPMASIGAAGVSERFYSWFEHWIKGDKNADTGAPVRLFIMGENVWRDENEWPLARTCYTPLYLNSMGDANLKNGGGELAFEVEYETQSDKYTYDPENPFNGVDYDLGTGRLCDRTEIEKRDDMIVYTTSSFKEDIEVTGDVEAKIYISSSAQDTDFMFTLIDVNENGKAYPLMSRMVRARYRLDPYEENLLTPGDVYEFNFLMGSTGILFKKGHSIRLEITSSDFPKYNRHTNTPEPIGSAKETVKAQQVIYHSEKYPSHIILPVIPR